jgi:F-type H+-transporting ATPase subunit b
MSHWFSRDELKRNLYIFIPAILSVVLLAVVAYASGHGGEGEAEEGRNWLNFGWRVLNFFVLVGFLYWLLAKNIKEFFVTRRTDIKASLEEAKAAKEEAQKKYAEYITKLDKATDEIKNITEMIQAQGLAEKEKIIEDARKAAEKVKEDTKARMEQEFKKASNELKGEAVQLSVQIAEEILKRNIKIEDHNNMVKDHLDKVVRKH